MPLAAIIPAATVIIGGVLNATGAVVNCYVLHKCRLAPSNEPYSSEDLTDSIIPGLNETVMARAEKEGRLAAADDTGYCGVPQYNFDMCHEDLVNVTIDTSIPAVGVDCFDNVPSTCMVLSTILTGGCGVNPPYPTV